MLTIPAMARMGPWMFLGIKDLGSVSGNCERCGEPIRYVWVMELQREPKKIVRIGSTCGPTLEEVSEHLWKTVTEPFNYRLSLLKRLERCARRISQDPVVSPGSDYTPEWFAAMRKHVAEGDLRRGQLRALGRNFSRLDEAVRYRMRGRVSDDHEE